MFKFLSGIFLGRDFPPATRQQRLRVTASASGEFISFQSACSHKIMITNWRISVNGCTRPKNQSQPVTALLRTAIYQKRFAPGNTLPPSSSTVNKPLLKAVAELVSPLPGCVPAMAESKTQNANRQHHSRDLRRRSSGLGQ